MHQRCVRKGECSVLNRKGKRVNGCDSHHMTLRMETEKSGSLIKKEREAKHTTGESFDLCIVGKERKLIAVDWTFLFFPDALSYSLLLQSRP